MLSVISPPRGLAGPRWWGPLMGQEGCSLLGAGSYRTLWVESDSFPSLIGDS